MDDYAEGEVRENTTSEKANMVFGIAIGLIFGGYLGIVLVGGESVEERSVDRVSYMQVNNTYREIGVTTGSGDVLECGVSRLDEVQISDSSYIYRNASCESSLQVDGGNVSMPVTGDLLFKAGNASSFSIGLDFRDEYVVCSVFEESEEKTGSDSYMYSPADCGSGTGSLYSKWNDSEFANFNVHERGEEVLKNESE
jgi:hypothetical protein